MKKDELLKKVVLGTNIKPSEAEVIIDNYLQLIKESCSQKGDFYIHKFGTFKLSIRAARKGRNVRTGEEIMIPQKRSLTFKVSETLKRELN